MSSRLVWLLLGSLTGFCSVKPVMAQTVTPTVGTGDAGTIINNTGIGDTGAYTITGGTQQLNTLFHSFEDFSPNTHDVTFDLDGSQSGVDTVISRVTGDNISLIDGALALTGGNSPDLFLINPRGITFGPNASLLLPGSFVASTAESVLFDGGLEFSATNPESPPLLTVSAPVGLQGIGLQMGEDSGDIHINNTGHDLTFNFIDLFTLGEITAGTTQPGLRVDENQTLAMVGRHVVLDGGILSALNGQTYLGAVSAPDTLNLTESTSGWQLDDSGVSQFGDITLSQEALIRAGDIGAVALRGNNIYLQDGSVIWQENTTSQAAEQLHLQAANRIELQGMSPSGLRNSIVSTTRSDGQGGDILLAAAHIWGRDDGMYIQSSTSGTGQGGNIALEAEAIEIEGKTFGSLVELRTVGPGDAGSLSVNTRRLRLVASAIVNNVRNGSGNAGRININASESILMGPNINGLTLIGSSAVSANGNAGKINITTPNLTLQDGALISSSTFGAGDAGQITINASDQITLTGEGTNAVSGNALVEPTRIRTAGVLSPSFIQTLFGLPDRVTGSSGNIVLNTNILSVTDNAEVTVGHDDAGSGGSIQVNANQVFLRDGGRLLASNQSGTGGNIQLDVQALLSMKENALINAESMGNGDGGNILIKAPVIIGLDNSDIVASAITGNGGNIAIMTQLFLGPKFRDQRTPGNDITASSQFGISGTVDISSFATDPGASLVKLPEAPVEADDQVAAACASGEGNYFVASGRGGLPSSPTQLIAGNQPLSDLGDDAVDAGEHETLTTYSGINRLLSEQALSELALSEQVLSKPKERTNDTVAEASSWQFNRQGQVELLSTPRMASLPNNPTACLDMQPHGVRS